VLYNFPYPSLSDAPNGPAQIQALAQAVENKIAQMDTTVNSAVVYTNNLATIGAPITDQIAFLTTSNSFFKYNGTSWLSYNPICHLYQTSGGTQSIPNITPTAISFNAEIVDDLNGHQNAPNPTRYTPPVSGYYACWGLIALPATGSYDFLAQFRKNGSLVVGAAPYGGARTFSSGFIAVTAQSSATFPMNGTTDYIELWTNQNSGGSITTFSNGTDQQSAMRITRIGPL
jgi:hypothetical protein